MAHFYLKFLFTPLYGLYRKGKFIMEILIATNKDFETIKYIIHTTIKEIYPLDCQHLFGQIL